MSDNRGEELQVTDQQTAAGLRPRGSASRYGGQRDREAPIGPKARGGATRGDQEAGLWPEDREETLLPAENFGDQPAGERFATLLRLNEPTTASGPDSPTIALWLGCRCAGWPRTPTGREFYEAVRAKRPTSRQRAILDAWANQADWTEVLQAWAEHAYTMRELVAALRRNGLGRCRIARSVNRWAKRPAGPRDQ